MNLTLQRYHICIAVVKFSGTFFRTVVAIFFIAFAILKIPFTIRKIAFAIRRHTAAPVISISISVCFHRSFSIREM